MDLSGNVIISGYEIGSLFLKKYTTDGLLLWSKGITIGGDSRAPALAIDPLDGDILIAGNYNGDYISTIDGLSQCNLSTVDGSSATNIFLARFKSDNGSCQWIRSFGDINEEAATAIAIDGVTREIVLTGYFSNVTNLGAGRMTGSSLNTFLVKYDATATQVKWVKVMKSTDYNRGNAVVIDQSSGDVLLAGGFKGTIETDGGSILTSTGSYDIFLVRYAFDGAQLKQEWVKSYGGSGSFSYDLATCIALDKYAKYFVVGGTFGNSISFDQALTSPGGTDMFLLRMVP